MTTLAVSFAQPWVLLGLLAVPLALIAYAGMERRRRASAHAFASPALLASVAPGRPGWRRHAPLALYLLGAVVLLFALAKPQKTVAVPVENAAIMLATDHSGSMQATDVAPNRLVAARNSAVRFLEKVPGNIQIGVVAFNQTARTLQTPTRDREAAKAVVGGLRPSGGTATGEAITASLAALARRPGAQARKAPAAIVLLSDGASTRGRDPLAAARDARKAKVPIYTVALGTANGTITVPTPSGSKQTKRVPPDAAALRQIAQISRGRSFTASDADQLSAVYEQLGSQVGRRDVRREITSSFTAGALALLAAGGLLSMHWFRRLP
jgi:Ca-activated chloride channel family protein